MRILALAFVTMLVLRGVAFASDADVRLANRTTVSAALTSAGDRQVFGAILPAGAKYTVVIKPAKGGPSLRAGMTGPTGLDLGSRDGKALSFKGTAAASGRHEVSVEAADGTSIGAYAVTISWKSAKGVSGTIVVDPGATGSLAFAADAAATATVTLSRAKGSSAVPVLAEIEGPDGVSAPIAAGASASLPLRVSGDYVIRFGAGAAGGGVNAKVAVKPPKARKTKVLLTALAGGAEVSVSGVIGPEGGDLTVGGGPLDGASISIPAGSLGQPTPILLGSAFGVAGQQPGVAAGPAIFAGPEGLSFQGGTTATLTIPFDPAVFGADTSKLRVYTRAADGSISLVPNPVIDIVNHVVTIPASHFSAFQVLSEFVDHETQLVESAPGSGRLVLGTCLAVSGDVMVASRRVAPPNQYEAVAFHRAGGAFVFETVLAPPSVQSYDALASTTRSIAASGDRVLVGAPGRDSVYGIHSGAGLVFLRDATGSWSLEAELSLATSGANEFDGGVVDLDGDTAAVGASGIDAVHVYVRDGSSGVWSLEQTLQGPPGSNFLRLGSLRGDTVTCTALDSEGSMLLVFHRGAGGWTLSGAIRAPDLGGGAAQFGTTSVDGTTIAAWLLPENGSKGSEVRVYEDRGAGFPEVARLRSADLAGPGESAGFAFGRSVSLRGDLLLVGDGTFRTMPFGSSGRALVSAGNAFLYRRMGGLWRFAARFRGTPADAFPLSSNDGFGSSIALDGTTAVASAPGRSTIDGPIGAIYVFDLSAN